MLTSIISSTYEQFAKSSILLLHQEMILKKNDYITDDYYGGIILLPFPLSIFNILFVPFYFFIDDKAILKKLNKILLFIGYTPLFIFVAFAYICFELVLIPIGFVKILLILIYELIVGNNHYQTKTISRINNFFFGLLILLIYPLWSFIAIVIDFTLYVRCLFFDVVFDVYYHLENDEVTPFILNKVGEIFNDKSKRLEIPLESIITEFVDQLEEFNKNYNFKNLLLLGGHPVDNINLIKDYSVFVKFIHQLKLSNEYNQPVVHKKFLIKLCESNANYVKIMKYIQKDKQYNTALQANNEVSSRDVKMEIELVKMPSSDLLKTPTVTEEEINKKLSKQQILDHLEKIPKLFYKRLSIINLRDCYNAMNHVKNFENMNQNQNKIKNDSRNIRKNITDILNVINAKKITIDKRKSKAIDSKEKRFSSSLNRMSSLVFNRNDQSGKREEGITDYLLLKENKIKRSFTIDHDTTDIG